MELGDIKQTLTIPVLSSKEAHKHGLVISIRESDSRSALVIVGAPGLLNVEKKLHLGDAVLYETPTHGMIELRAMRISGIEVEVLLTRISPRLGLTGGLDPQSSQNAPFTADEIARIGSDLEAVKSKLAELPGISQEQLDLLGRGIQESIIASSRLGRKDWIMFVAGTLSNIVVGAAFSPEGAKALFTAMNQQLGWMLQHTLRLAGA